MVLVGETMQQRAAVCRNWNGAMHVGSELTTKAAGGQPYEVDPHALARVVQPPSTSAIR